MRSNVTNWQKLQRDGYFDNHPEYLALKEAPGTYDLGLIPRFLNLDKSMKVVVIGCGFGRESSAIAPLVGHVYGIDVEPGILDRARAFVASQGSTNFTPVLFERFESDIPDGIDLVYSVVVMQHLTRDLVTNYFRALTQKLNPDGRFLVQFIQHIDGGGQPDAALEDYEPSVSWTSAEIVAMLDATGGSLIEMRTTRVIKGALWHWVLSARQ